MTEPSLMQALLDAIGGTLDPHTQIADHPNVKFAQMRRLDLVQRAEIAEDIVRRIVYASDLCMGHRSCGHSMQPWQDARALILRLDGGPSDSTALTNSSLRFTRGPDSE